MLNKQRYIRQIQLPQIGNDGQNMLQNAKVLVIGAGGLGCAVLPYLASSGIGLIGIVEGDVVSESNLHRQVLYNQTEVGKLKAVIAKQKLDTLNPTIKTEIFPNYLTGENALNIISGFDILVDATDDIATRYLINDACVLLNKPFVHASIFRFQLQVAVFNYNDGPTYRCLYPTATTTNISCADAGVMPTTVALAGMYQAHEVLKICLQIGEVYSGKLLLIDTLTNQQNVFTFKKKVKPILKSEFKERHQNKGFKNASFTDVKVKNAHIIDVREIGETPIIENKLIQQIPLSTLKKGLRKLDVNQSVYVFCKSGRRSKMAAEILTDNGFKHVTCIAETAEEIQHLI